MADTDNQAPEPIDPETLQQLAKAMPAGLHYLHPFLTDDWQQCVAVHAQVDKALLILSQPDPDLATPEQLAKAVDGARAQWLLEAPESPEALEAFAKAGRPYKLPGAPDRLFCSSFSVGDLKAETKAEKIAKLIAALPDEIPIIKAHDGDEGYVLGIVLEPEPFNGKGDAQGDVYSAAEVRKAAHRWVAKAQRLGLMHEEILKGAVLADSFVIPEESKGLTVGKTTIKAGTWLLGFYLDKSRPEWPAIKRGDFTGLSIGGMARRRPA